MKTRVFVSGPITHGDINHNVNQARAAFVALMKAGYAPYFVHGTCFVGGDSPSTLPHDTTPDDWYSVDLPWVAVADCVLRLPGRSDGADLEEKEADRCGIPVYRDIDVLKAAEPTEQPGDQEYLAVLDEMKRLHRKKASDYGTKSHPFANIEAAAQLGISIWKAAWLRGMDKVRRIITYCQTGKLANEGVEDSFIDLAAYALISLVYFRRERRGDVPSSNKAA